MKILIGMSGGVDSSVAAFLLKETGHEVVGVSFKLFTCNRITMRSCCSERDRNDARLVCENLGIPHHTIDLTARFNEKIIEPFVDSYLKGETPSPCVRCNEHIKFDGLFDAASEFGADAVATGHYARIEREPDRRYVLKRGIDGSKDQSYFLFPILGRDLSKVHFPLGGFTKGDVRMIARKSGLPVYDKGESQEVCFVPGDDYAAFIGERSSDKLPGSGIFVDSDGRVMGRHGGFYSYTIGQRRGLGFGMGKRKYVVRIDAQKNQVVLGDDLDLFKSEMDLKDVIWASGRRIPTSADVKIRSTHSSSRARIESRSEGVRVIFEESQRAIAPGQAAVIYDGDEVIGGGWITEDKSK